MNPADRDIGGFFNLKDLLSFFPELGKRYLGAPKFAELEDLFKPLREGIEPFSLKHVELIQDREKKYWGFLTFWKIPEISEADLKPLAWAFKGLKRKGTDTSIIENLFAVIKNIEVVSCILRFVEPANYAIMSPPVENLLGTRGSTQTDKYFHYLSDLHELKAHYNFNRIADVDLALWSLARILNADNLKNEYPFSGVYEAYKKTSNHVKTIMARNSLAAVYDNEPIIVARLLCDTDPILGGMIAGRQLELAINNLMRRNGVSLKTHDRDGKLIDKSIYEKLRDLKDKQVITPGEENDLNAAWEIRCACTHPKESRKFDKELPAKNDILWMIDQVAAFIENYQIALSLEAQYLGS